MASPQPAPSGAELRVSLLYPAPQPFQLDTLVPGLTGMLSNVGLEVRSVAAEGRLLRLATGGPELILSTCAAPLDRAALGGARRPEGGLADDHVALRRLERNAATIGLSLVQPTDAGRRLTNTQATALMQRMARFVLRTWRADLVLWQPNVTIYTAEEFCALRGGLRVVPRRPAAPPAANDSGRSPRPQLSDVFWADPVPAFPQDAAAEPPARTRRIRPRRFHRDAGGTVVANDTPSVPPPMTEVYDRLKTVFRQAQDTMERPVETDPDSLPGQLGVYVLTGTVVVMSFPVGMGLLTYNILKGGDLRATARVMALTGFGLAASTFTSLSALLA